MEKRKLLLVAISVGVFLVLTVGAAILLFTPKKTPAITQAAISNPAQGIDTGITIPVPPVEQPTSRDPIDLVRSPDVPGLQTPPEGTIRQDDNYYVYGSEIGTETRINVPKPSTAAVPDAAPQTRPASSTSTIRPSTSTSAVPSAVISTPATTAQRQTESQSETRIYDDYWVQTGAFSTVAKAEGVKTTLATKGINSIIENREIDGATFFRVRVGPYTSTNEANYWLSLIKTIDGFEDSQVRLTQSRR